MISNPLDSERSIYESMVKKTLYNVYDFGYRDEGLIELKTAIDKGIAYLQGLGYGTLEVIPYSGVSEHISYFDVVREDLNIKIRKREFECQ